MRADGGYTRGGPHDSSVVTIFRRRGMQWSAILFFVAAALALTAFLIDFSNDRVNWTVAAGALFMVALGFARLRKSRSQSPDSGR
jgi:hypothetical protein